jgi:hypothetical protein
MIIPEPVARWFRPAVYLGRNGISLTGAVLTTSSAVTLVCFWAFEIVRGGPIHPYAGIVFFLILPSFFAAGLVLIPIGVLWRRHKLRAQGELPEVYPRVDFGDPMLRHAFWLVALMTGLNVVIMGTASYRGVEYMDSAQFCGQTCHTVMTPEYTAYQVSPHQRVACVQCHIGQGASWFVRSKLSGVRQVLAVTFRTYHQPIPSPVEHLRPARETCEQCHWPQIFTGDKFLVKKRYSDDEQNTELTTVLLLKIGGRTWQGAAGIHGRHLDQKSRIQYISIDRQRQVIPQVNYTEDNGKESVFVSSDANATPQQLAAGEHRTMDCVDCHNRPTHVFQLPERGVDQAMSEGRINTQLPYIKKKAVEVLKADYPDRSTAALRISTALFDFYRASYPDVYAHKRGQIETAVAQVQAIYARNVFPEMKITWGTYPINIGHQDFMGCFRCHDGSHSTSDGRSITNDCDACHTLLAVDEKNPKVLADLAMK